jgi:hypothetical protein
MKTILVVGCGLFISSGTQELKKTEYVFDHEFDER